MLRSESANRNRAKFDLLDTNRDGHITMTEFTRFCEAQGIPAERIPPRFSRIDGNHDGWLSFQEFDATLRTIEKPPTSE